MSKEKSLHTIRVGIVRKINLSRIGGPEFESTDVVCEDEIKNVPEDQLSESRQQLEDSVFAQIEELTERRIKQLKKQFGKKGGETNEEDNEEGEEDSERKVKGKEVKVDKTEMETISADLNDLTLNRKNLSKLKKAFRKIKAKYSDGEISETQFKFLKKHYRKYKQEQ